ncbi:MAG: flagellar motor switch protein FliG [Rhodobacteraceae bacterium]|nr:flagellar motor switch protein FliG [Paracoccaceae bacterium]
MPNDLTLPTPPGIGAADFPAAPALTRRQKAAILVQALVSHGMRLPLNRLPDTLQTDLAEELVRMRPVDQATVHAVLEEFADQISSIGLSFPNGLEAALETLNSQISDTAAEKLRRRAGVQFHGDPWEVIGGADSERLVQIFEAESIEICAVILSKLKVSKAAEILSLLPGERARRTTYAVSRTGGVSPATVQRIGVSVARQLQARPVHAFTDGPVDRVGAILNSAPASTRDTVLEGLEAEDQGFAEEVRKAIFTFASIPSRIDARDIPKVIRVAAQEDLIMALAGAAGGDLEAGEFILANMSQRMADNLRGEAKEAGKVSEADAEAAMLRIVQQIRGLEATGEISLIADDS